jgi:endonuclease/exonuclease/phosphatase family metal-dependent hydrolase
MITKLQWQRRFLLLAVASIGVGFGTGANAAEPESIRVMSFNIWVGGESGKQPLSQTAAVIKASGADVVGLQEKSGRAPKGQPRPDNGAKLAELLGWHYFDQGGGSTAILSRYEIVGGTPEKWGARLKTPAGREFYLFNVHLAHAPYQPYQLLKIPYADAPDLSTADEAVASARAARHEDVTAMLAEAKAVEAEGLPMFVTGDFNEPSCHDWTPAAHAAKLCPTPVDWPTTKAVVAAGFRDSYRAAFPDPVTHGGLTWTPTTPPDDPKDRHDRIDFVFLAGPKVELKKVQIVGEAEENADIVVTPYPSDHRSVVAEVVVAH